MLVLLATLIVTYVRLGINRYPVPAGLIPAGERWAVHLPFSIYLGWITVATVANATDVLDYLQWNRFGLSPEFWMSVVLAAVLTIAGLMLFTRRDTAYTLVILWALGGIAYKFSSVPAVVIPTWITFGLITIGLVSSFQSQITLLHHLDNRPNIP